jgi:tRNA(fMet)-specific endonuclease VapC
VSQLESIRPSQLRLCSVVKGELVYGARKSARPAENLRVLQSFFEPFTSLSFDDACAEQYGSIRQDLERLGTPIGPYDLMIAATAIAHDVVLVTHNTNEFSRVVGLRWEDWEREEADRSGPK